MGYTTDFNGSFQLDKPLSAAQTAYLQKFSDTRRMKRDSLLAADRPDPIRLAVDLPVGEEGGYFVGELGIRGQGEGFGKEAHEKMAVLDYNKPPKGQPSLWCQWVPSDDGREIQWDGSEKFYSYTEWLIYLIEHFLKPWGYVLNGEVEWQGEDAGDYGKIVVENNRVGTQEGKRSYAKTNWA